MLAIRRAGNDRYCSPHDGELQAIERREGDDLVVRKALFYSFFQV
jgi:hypothetical protein